MKGILLLTAFLSISAFVSNLGAEECDTVLIQLQQKLAVLGDSLEKKIPGAKLQIADRGIKIHTGNDNDDVSLEFDRGRPEHFAHLFHRVARHAAPRDFLFITRRVVSSEGNRQRDRNRANTFVSDRGTIDKLRGRGLSHLMTEALVNLADYWNIGLIASNLDFSNLAVFMETYNSRSDLQHMDRMNAAFLVTPTGKGLARLGWQLDLSLCSYAGWGAAPQLCFVNPMIKLTK